MTGETYMLNQDEEMWDKELPPGVEALLAQDKDPLADRGMRAKGDGSTGKRDKSKVSHDISVHPIHF